MHNRLVTRLATAFAALALLLAAAAAAAPPDPAAQLLAAVAERDPLAIERAARQLGAGAIGRVADSGEGGAQRAAAFAAAFSPEATSLLDDLAIAAGDPDRSAAVVAVRAAQRIARDIESPDLLDLEVPRSETVAAVLGWFEVARDRERWADVRVGALQVARDLARHATDNPDKLTVELITDPDPEVRRGALELLSSPIPEAQIERVAARVTAEKEDGVALAAAASLCQGIGLGDPAGPTLRALGGPGLERIERLVLDNDLSSQARFDAAGCLAASKRRPARKALARLPRSLPPHLRGPARALGKRKATP